MGNTSGYKPFLKLFCTSLEPPIQSSKPLVTPFSVVQLEKFMETRDMFFLTLNLCFFCQPPTTSSQWCVFSTTTPRWVLNDAVFSDNHPWHPLSDAFFFAISPMMMRFFLQLPHDMFWMMCFFFANPFWVLRFFCQPWRNDVVWILKLFQFSFAFSLQNHANLNPGIQEPNVQRNLDSTARSTWFWRSG